MSLFKRGDIWHAYVWVNGVRYHKSTGTTNRRKAETIERQYRDELNDMRQRLPPESQEMTFGALVARFIADGMARPHALDRLKHLLPFFSEYLIPDITTGPVRKYRQERYKEKTLKPATVNRDLSVLRRILNWGAEEGLIAANPLGRVHMERERKTKRQVLSLREEKLLLAAAPAHLQRIILCALDTGMRRGEILQQRLEDIDFDNRILYVTRSKTPEGEAREVPLTNRLYESLKANRKDRGPVFTYEGNAVKQFKTTWATSLRRAGIRHVRFHDLRHTANTRMMLAGVLQEVRREIVGHSSQRSRDVNDRYVQIELPEKREAIRKLEVWLESQAQLLAKEEAASLLSQSTTTTGNTAKDEPNDGTQQEFSAA